MAESSPLSPEKAYRTEWRDSCVADTIIEANVRYVEDDEAVDLLTEPAISEMGGHAAQYATQEVIRLRQRYEHVLAGGWWVSGLDPLNDWKPMEWGQFNPITPRYRWDVPEKPIKYEGQAKQSTRAIFLDGAVDWRRVQTDPQSPRLWTEGAKKAGAALTAGYNAIALPGVFSGYRTKDVLGNPIEPYLIADVEAMAQPGSIHYLAFDQDDKPETVRKVAVALSRFGKLLEAQGCEVRVVRWSSAQGKGIDDLIAGHGPNAFHQAVRQALTFEEWQIWQALDNRLTLAPSIQLKVNDLTALGAESIPDIGIIAIASSKGTGKTNFIKRLIKNQEKALLAGHRISLMRNLCERFDLDYRGDLDKQDGRFFTGGTYTLRIGTCLESLLAINPEDFRGCDLILDEVCQVLRQLLTSSTCNKDGKRPVLLMRFRELIRAAKRVIIADADLNDHTIRYLQSLREEHKPPFLVRNDYQAPGYAVRFIESADASAITSELLADIKAGLRIYIATDSKQGSKRIHRLIAELRRHLQAQGEDLLINSETSSGELEKAFMKAPDQHLTTFMLQSVTASPSAGTGLSIEGPHFDKVYGIFWGNSINDADMSQALIRPREPVERVVWCAKYGRNFSKVGRETNPSKLRDLLRQKTTTNTLLIRASLSELSHQSLSTYDWDNDPHIDLWAHIETEGNRSMWNLRTALRVRLMHEGHDVKRVVLGSDNQANILLKAARDELKTEHALNVEKADNLNPIEAKQLEQLDGLEEAQRLALQKWQIAEFYCVPVSEVDAELVLWDNNGRRRGQLINLEGFLSPEVAIAADIRSLEKQAQWQKGYTPWDLSNASLKRWMREQLGLMTYLQLDQEWDGESLADFKALALSFVAQIKAALNFTVTEKLSAVQILNQLLEQMGLVCVGQQSRIGGGDRIRTYRLEPCSWQLNAVVLERRKARRESRSEAVTPSASIDQSTTGCDSPLPLNTATCGLWRWGTSLSPWAIVGQDGEIVQVKGLSGVVMLAPMSELRPW